VRKLHRVFKSMHWNSIRYCIGFPPEMWYRIADEEGLLIQDEFPIWYGGNWPKELTSETLVREYSAWMRERWNHPCVVIWDAQNETFSAETGKAIQTVRHLDLSGRPWDNGWSPPQSPSDCYEAHPYVFSSSAFRLADFAALSGAPGVPGGMPGAIQNTGKNPAIINEYSWGHLDRNGQPTIPWMEKFYEDFLGPRTTVAERQEFHARVMAAETEFWRAKRQVAGVLHFCGLAYSKPKAVTSDHFADIESLTLEPFFAKYVGDAFAPVGLMIDFWGEQIPGGQKSSIPVVLVNDLEADWQGSVHLAVVRDQKTIVEQEQACRVAGFATQTVPFDVAVPHEQGRYQLIAQLRRPGQPAVESWRDFAVVSEAERSEELARGRPVTASSSVTVDGTTYLASYAVDGNIWTRWSSEFSDSQWLAIDLGRTTRISRVELLWEAAYGKAYAIQVSEDGKNWKTVYQTDAGKGGIEVIRFSPVEGRWVRMLGSKRGSPTGGYSLFELKVFR
jgi:beta-galactosidase